MGSVLEDFKPFQIEINRESMKTAVSPKSEKIIQFSAYVFCFKKSTNEIIIQRQWSRYTGSQLGRSKFLGSAWLSRRGKFDKKKSDVGRTQSRGRYQKGRRCALLLWRENYRFGKNILLAPLRRMKICERLRQLFFKTGIFIRCKSL